MPHKELVDPLLNPRSLAGIEADIAVQPPIGDGIAIAIPKAGQAACRQSKYKQAKT